ncbi:hypothetical protein BOVMAS28_18670 [Streptococcus uberis]
MFTVPVAARVVVALVKVFAFGARTVESEVDVDCDEDVLVETVLVPDVEAVFVDAD